MKTNFNLLTLGILLSFASAGFAQPVITTQPESSTNVAGTSTRVIYHQSQQSSALRLILRLVRDRRLESSLVRSAH